MVCREGGRVKGDRRGVTEGARRLTARPRSGQSSGWNSSAIHRSG